jgi:hypothetical protein
VPNGRHATAWIGGGQVCCKIFGKGLGTAASVAVIILGAGIAEVSALPLTPFRYEAQAQRHCPGDKVVWLDFRKGVYYAKGQKRYGLGFDGSFVCLNEVRDSFYRRSLLGLR